MIPEFSLLISDLPREGVVMIDRTIGLRLKERRLEKKLTRNELANRAQVSYRTVANIETGKSRGNDKTRFALLDALNSAEGKEIAFKDIFFD